MTCSASLTIHTALETCESFPRDEKCGICIELLSNAPAVTSQTVSENVSQDHADHEVVKTKVCGDAHFFHRICIMAWFHSATPNLNTCPIDRNVLFGTERIAQPLSNVPSYVEFPGHDVEDHEEFYAGLAHRNTAPEPEPDFLDPERAAFFGTDDDDEPAVLQTPFGAIADWTQPTPEEEEHEFVCGEEDDPREPFLPLTDLDDEVPEADAEDPDIIRWLSRR